MDFLVDIGNVLLCFDFEPALKTLIPKRVKNPQERMERLIVKKDEFESGQIHEDEYIEWASEQLGFTGDRKTFINAWVSIFTRNEPMWDLCRQLKSEKHRLIFFSNTNSLHAKYFEENHKPFEYFDEAIYSFQIGSIKPQSSIYQYAIDKYQLEPATTVYIDDLKENIKTGKEFGFHSWQYHVEKHEELEQWLKEIRCLT